MGASATVKGLEEQVEYGQSGTRPILVTHEALLDLIEAEPSLALMKGVPDVLSCLKALGFRIESHKSSLGNIKYTGYSELKHQYVRCDHDKTKAMKTTLYSGLLDNNYAHKYIYNSVGVYTGSPEREKLNKNIVDIASFNEYYSSKPSDALDKPDNLNGVEHTLHCSI